MTSDSIETDDKPCPLTVGEWMAFLTAESQTIHGYKQLVVVMLLAAFSIVFSGYVAGMTHITARFGSSGDYMQLIFGVVYWVAFGAVLIRYFTLTRDIIDKKDEKSEIIRDIVSGELTDPDKIRKRWENRDTPANAEELLKICEKQIETRWKIVKFLKLTGYSFVGNFKAIKENIQFDTLNESEAGKFIDACENRRERAKTLLKEIAPLIGFDVIAMTVVATIVHKMAFHPLYAGLLIFLFISFIFLFAMLAHYRTHVHAWTAFKEGAILQKPPTEE
jgi:hypothetical protein